MSASSDHDPFSKSFIPAWGWVFAVLCGIIPVLTLGGAIPAAIGIGGASACANIARMVSLPLVLRMLACAGLTTVCWTVFLLLLGGLTLLDPSGPSDAGQLRSLVENYGRYGSKTRTSAEITRAASGGFALFNDKETELLEQTDRIPCKVGERWGVRIRTWNVPTTRTFLIRQEMIHPPIRQPDGSFQTKSISEFESTPDVTPGPYFGWQFVKGHEEELVTGEWTLSVFVDNVEVAHKAFKVQKESTAAKQSTARR
jgi:hypothetical protein